MDQQISQIVVLRGGGVGDFVLTLPLLGSLRRHWPDAQLELIAHPSIAELARGRYYADTVRAIESAVWARMFTGQPINAGSDLHAYWSEVDLVVSFLADPERLLENSLSGLVRRYLQVTSPESGFIHAADHFLHCLKPLGLSPSDPQPRLYPSRADQAAAAAILEHLLPTPRRPIVTIHPGSGSPSKNWPADRFAELIRRLSESRTFDLLILSGEADQETVDRIKRQPVPVQPAWLEQPPLVHLAALFEKVALHVGNDSGISHLAAASGAPVLALFGPTSPQTWRPLGNNVRVLDFREATVDRVYAAIVGHDSGPARGPEFSGAA
jgi:heptosyltransferase III